MPQESRTDIGVVYLRKEPHLWRCHWVLFREEQLQTKHAVWVHNAAHVQGSGHTTPTATHACAGAAHSQAANRESRQFVAPKTMHGPHARSNGLPLGPSIVTSK